MKFAPYPRAPNAAKSLLIAWVAALVACAGPAPLSGPRPAPATAAGPTPPGAPPRAPPPGAGVAPAVIAPPVAALPGSGPASPPPSDKLVLVLPLKSALYSRAAEAVRMGFLAAANAAGRAEQIQVIGHGDDDVLPAFVAAAQSDPALVIGPLTRDDLKTVITMAPLRPRMLALNQPDDATPLPEHGYALALSVESDAGVLARRAWGDGVRTIAAVVSDAPLQRRFAAAFVAAWERAGGERVRDYRFDPNPEVLELLRRELTARPVDAVLLAVGSSDAALAKSFLPTGPVYASSQITDALAAPMLRDLDGVRYVEIPWLAEPWSPALARLPHANLGDPVLERLYALGLDAFALGELLANPVPPQRIELDGATGHLSLLPSHVFARVGRVMLIRDGESIPYPPEQ